MSNRTHFKKGKRPARDNSRAGQANSNQAQKNPNNQVDPLERVRQWFREWNRADTIQALLLVSAVVGIAVVIWRNWQSDEQWWLENGPDINAVSARFLSPPTVGQPLAVEIRVRNTGGMTATVVPDGKIQIADLAFFPDGAYENIDGQRLPVPNGATAVFTITRTNPLTAPEWAGLQDGTKEMLIHGAGLLITSRRPPAPLDLFRFCYQWRTSGMGACDNRGFINTDKAMFR